MTEFDSNVELGNTFETLEGGLTRDMKEFEQYLGWIRNGHTVWANNAGKIAQKHGLDTTELDNAIETGEKKEFEEYLGWIRNGETHWVEHAGKIAQKYGLLSKIRLLESQLIGNVRKRVRNFRDKNA